MTVYNEAWLYNLYIREQADEALYEEAIPQERYQALYAATGTAFYTPNIFVRIGLGFGVFIITLFSCGLLALMFSAVLRDSDHIDGFLSFLCLVTGSACLFFALHFIRTRNDYNSGRDNMLVWLSVVSYYSAVVTMLPHGTSNSLLSFMGCIMALVAGFVFMDTLMSVIALLCLLLFIYFACSGWGQAVASFVMMGVSWAVYYVLTGMERLYPIFRNCIYYLRLVALLTLYAAGNYYMLSKAAVRFQDNTYVVIGGPLGIFYWIWTLGLPVAYIAIGIVRKHLMLVRTGALLVIAGILTFRYFHSLLPAEIALTLGGIICILLASVLLTRLKEPKYGFTAQRGFSGYDKKSVELLLEDKMTKPAGDDNKHQE